MDLNDDGKIDLLVNGYDGFSYIFYGKNINEFCEVQKLTDEKNSNINAGKYYVREEKNYITLDVDNPDKANYIKAIDWDNDGDLDLLLSGNKTIKLCLNIGTSDRPLFSSQRVTLFTDGYYVDDVTDWDGDGLWDIICGSDSKGVFYYKNIGTRKKPAFDPPKTIIKPDQLIIDKFYGGRIGLSKVDVADYNGDGKKDLIIGNMNSVYIEKLNLNSVQIYARDSLLKRFAYLDAKNQSIIEEVRKTHRGERHNFLSLLSSDSSYMSIQKDFRKTYLEKQKYMPKSITHGYVFVFIRK